MKVNKYGNKVVIILYIYLIFQTAIALSFPFRYSTQKNFSRVSALILFFFSIKYIRSYFKNKDTVYLYLFSSVFFMIGSLILAGYAAYLPKQEILYKDGDLEYYAYPDNPGWRKDNFYVKFHLKDSNNDQYMFDKPTFMRIYNYHYYDDIALSLDQQYFEVYYVAYNDTENSVEKPNEEIIENQIQQGQVVTGDELIEDVEKIIKKDDTYYYLKVIDVAMGSFQSEIFESTDQAEWISLGDLPYHDEIYDIKVQGDFIFLAFPPRNDQAQIIVTQDFKSYNELQLDSSDDDNIFLEDITYENSNYTLSLSSPRWNEQVDRSIYKSTDGIIWEYQP